MAYSNRNAEKFNEMLNSCRCQRQVYAALLTLAKPTVQQADHMPQEGQIPVGELRSLLEVAKGL